MGFWFNIKRLFWPTKFNDPFFGRLVLGSPKEWWGWKYFSPIHCEFRVRIFADELGPQGFQREFFTELELRYSSLMPYMADALQKQYNLYWQTTLQGSVWDEFSP